MALQGTGRRQPGSKSHRAAPADMDAIILVKEFAEQKRKKRENDPNVRRMKNRYKLKPSVSPSPGNTLHSSGQLLLTVGTDVLLHVPPPKSDALIPGDDSSDQLETLPARDCRATCGRQMPLTPSSTKTEQSPGLKEVQPNTQGRALRSSTQKIVRKNAGKIQAVTTCDTLPDSEKENSTGVTAHKGMTSEDTERRQSGWTCSKTALGVEEAVKLLKELAEQKWKERPDDAEGKCVERKPNLKVPAYPSPGNILHTGRQLPRTPGPGVLPLLPSQKFDPQVPDEDLSEEQRCLLAKEVDNRVPCGRQLRRTPTAAEPEQSRVLRGVQPTAQECPPVHSTPSRTVRTSEVPNNSIRVVTECCMVPDSENENPTADLSAHKETHTEEMNSCSPETRIVRRISELPVKGLNQIRVSGILSKLPGYERRTADLEFLKLMENQEKAKALKAELQLLRKNLVAAKQNKELLIAKKEKIDNDIQKMKCAYERTVQLGRAFLSRTQDATHVQDLTHEDLLEKLNLPSIQSVLQQERARLVAAEREVIRRQQEASSKARYLEDTQRSLKSKMESCQKDISAAGERLRQLKDEVVSLKTQIEKTEKKKSELKQSIQRMRERISQYSEQQLARHAPAELSEEDQEIVNRRLQRLLLRKQLYEERERILQKLKQDLK
ncbi:cingulin-like [Hyperolius riggenbachi]|uniref:cingulin-like n=1 Tax=Hyperolius riggenbachi TaxID=752182 RepID=UPI0035A325EF